MPLFKFDSMQTTTKIKQRIEELTEYFDVLSLILNEKIEAGILSPEIEEIKETMVKIKTELQTLKNDSQ
jgi:hypothetical protein